MCWPAAKKFASDLLLPSSVWAEQLGRDDIPSFVSSLRAAHPDIEIGEEKELLCAETYEHEAVLRGELETQSRDLYVLVLRTDRDIVGGTIIEYDADENTVVGRMSFVSSSVRGLGLGRALLRVQKSLAIARGAQSTWGLVELDNPAQTRLMLERLGKRADLAKARSRYSLRYWCSHFLGSSTVFPSRRTICPYQATPAFTCALWAV